MSVELSLFINGNVQPDVRGSIPPGGFVRVMRSEDNQAGGLGIYNCKKDENGVAIFPINGETDAEVKRLIASGDMFNEDSGVDYISLDEPHERSITNIYGATGRLALEKA